MRQELKKLAQAELRELNQIVDEVMKFPDDVFRANVDSCMWLHLHEDAEGLTKHELMEEKAKSQRRFDALCKSVPGIPRRAVSSLGVTYMSLIALFFDEGLEWAGDICAVKSLMAVSNGKGLALGLIAGASTAPEDARKMALSMIGKIAADVRHAPNRDSKQKVFAWCYENMERFGSMDDAALDIAETFVSQKFRAVRDWMTEWNKQRKVFSWLDANFVKFSSEDEAAEAITIEVKFKQPLALQTAKDWVGEWKKLRSASKA